MKTMKIVLLSRPYYLNNRKGKNVCPFLGREGLLFFLSLSKIFLEGTALKIVKGDPPFF